MYGLVLLVAVTAGSESADFGRRGGCGGCYGRMSYSCRGCYGCGGYASNCYSCGGYVSSSYGCGGYASSNYGYGGYVQMQGCGGYASNNYGYGGYIPTQGCGGTVISTAPRKTVATVSPNAATIVVTLPADAKLTIDGAETTSTSSVRTFESPALEPGKVYSYTLIASYPKSGQTVNVSKKIKIEAGKVSNVDLLEANSTTDVASN